MTMTDGERAIVAQLKRIADILDPPTDRSFADTPKRFTESVAAFGIPLPSVGGHALSYQTTIPTESSNAVWERIMRGGEGDHLLNPDADHTGDPVE